MATAQTTAQLLNAINESIKEFSASLRPLVEEASRRLSDGQVGDSLMKLFRYATHILASIEKEKPI
jgi:hypothetical protein